MDDTSDTTVPLPQFQGIWLSREVMELLWSGKLSPRAAMLYASIYSLVEKGKGCYASNAYLAVLMGVEPRQIREMLETLKELELVYQSEFDGRRRYLKIKYEAEGGEKSPPCPAKNRHPARREIATLPGEKSPPYNKGESKGKEKVSPNGDGAGLISAKERSNPAQAWGAEAATILYNAARRRGFASDANLPKWRLRFAKVPAERRGEVMSLLKWYVEHHMGKDQYSVQAYCPETFLKKYDQIKAARAREETATGGYNGEDEPGRDEIICMYYRRKTGLPVIRIDKIPQDELVPLIADLEARGKI